LKAAGYDVGHEVHGKIGMSNWMSVSRHSWWQPSKFNHVFMLVRHPLKVVKSWQSSSWPSFVYKNVTVGAESVLQDNNAFNKLQGSFKALEWWITFTLLAENAAECSMRNEDISPQLIKEICTRAKLKNCELVDWVQIIDKKKAYNSHVARGNATRMAQLPSTWEDLQNSARSVEEIQVLDHARELCKRWYDVC
jgi:hypothetical protein